ncbi:DUF2239 family protein [Massilia sp. Dwa41.01b]|uniref:DUF2239 family protein n=1 Tax=unclassified Massilia TaxID=2609279 RepID=UPI0016006023|nr:MULTISPECIES: DUF2239 family protein [unclassified Massilia]QNA87817.1 DUF2239 family protein [Massilia sp. Dwa41.01b]QNA98719.1 DUF2239 family protein [Massilia sp. Se16.2.3]
MLPTDCIAFLGTERLARGPLIEVVRAVKAAIDSGSEQSIALLDSRTSRPVEINFTGTEEEVLQRIPRAAPRSAGRPKLGVVAREVTLLPRHWEWLASQPGGASVALRKLVELASRDASGDDARREARDAAYRFMHELMGDAPGFEEASRALFAGDGERFRALVAAWPQAVRAHLLELAEPSFVAAGRAGAGGAARSSK